MTNFVKLNKAAVSNLLDGNAPPFAVIRAENNGLRITPYKIHRDGSQRISDNRFPIPDAFTCPPSQALGVKLDDRGDLIIYPTLAPRKSTLPSAKIMKGVPKEAREPEPANIPTTVSAEPQRLKASPSMLIRGSEISAAAPVKPVEMVVVEEAPEVAMERRLRANWNPSPQKQDDAHVANFAVSPTPKTLLGVRRETERTIIVPISFDRRRGMGQRAVDVIVKRRRFS